VTSPVRRSVLGAVAAVVLLAGCGGTAPPGGRAAGGAGDAAGDAAGGAEALRGEVVVAAAASLTGAFTAIAEDFERAHPGVTVTLNLGASSALAAQIVQGAPVDVFAAASPATMATVTRAGAAAGEPTVFVRNRLQIAVPRGNPAGVRSLADLGRADLRIALCAEQVPCGAAALTVFAAAGVVPAPDTLEQDVKATLSKVALGEVDAALVYRTDVLGASGGVAGVPFPEAGRAVNDYPIVAVEQAPNPAAATAFVAHVLSAEGARVLTGAGFERP